MPEATIASFVLRFTQDHTARSDPVYTAWRGVIRHVQTNEEIRFTQIDGALAFIARYVDITSCGVVETEDGESPDPKPISEEIQNSDKIVTRTSQKGGTDASR